jgi:hypothetical protein
LSHHGSYLFAQVFDPSTLAPLRHPSSRTMTGLFFKRLPCPSTSRRMPLLALTVPQTLTYLSSNVWANLTLLRNFLRCDDFGLSFSLKVITLRPQTLSLSWAHLHLADTNWYFTHHSHQHSHQISSSCRTFLRKVMIATVARVCEWVVCQLTWDSMILPQAVDNLETISESYQLPDACVWRRERKRRKTWPVNIAWDSYHVLLRRRTEKC